jgi:alpha-tubulin suppressor-like RCC1 family protein
MVRETGLSERPLPRVSGTQIGVAALACALIGCGGTGTPAQPLTGALTVSLSSTHACALVAGGGARCWGEDVWGQLGDGQSTFAVVAPVAVPGLTGLAGVVAGFGYSCGLEGDGAVACWGNDLWNQIGDQVSDGGLSGGNTRHVQIPAPTGVVGLGPIVDGLATAGAEDLGGAYTCAHMTDGTVQCWGENALGLGGANALSTPPTTIPGLTHVRGMAFGGPFGCFALDDGTASCMGLGSLGQAVITASETPITVPGLSGVKSVAAGNSHACVLVDDGTVRCWGLWEPGAATLVPVVVQGLAGVTAIAAGGFETCALLTDGGVTCWGPGASATPQRVSGLGSATAISVAGDFACAVIQGGTIQCWGTDTGGRLGNGGKPNFGPPNYVATPVTVVAATDGGA